MGDTPTGKLVASITPGLIFSVAIFMVLEQLGIAPAIVIITYAAIIGSVALGAALAFGLGGREAAARVLEQAQLRASEQAGRVRSDVALGAERGREMAQNAREQVAGDRDTEAASQAPMQPSPQFGESVESFQPGRRRRRDSHQDSTVDNVIPPGSDER
jgi:hypothetical protein